MTLRNPVLNSMAATAHVFTTLQAQAAAQGITLRAVPLEPTTCCGRGCNGCVWEGFYAAAEGWRDEALELLAPAAGASALPSHRAR